MAKAKKATPVEGASGKDAALHRVIAQIEKQYGQGSIMQMDEHSYAKIEGISTGSLSLDIALGGAGIPRGRITELFGPESSGKTTLALHAIAEAQKLGGVAAFIDAEHALDTTWAKRLGVDVSSLLVSQPDTGEQALDIAQMLIASNSVDIIVVDSVAALTPKAEIEGEMGDAHVGLQARLMSQAMRKLTAIINKSRTALVFINQIRMKIGVMFGNPETTPGGKALKFYSSVRVDLRRITTLKDAKGAIGSRVRARIVKNKIAPPFRETEFDIMFDSGISYEGDLLDLALASEVVQRSGAWLNYGDLRLGQGRENAKTYLVENPDLRNEIRDKVLATKGLSDLVKEKTPGEPSED
ncbi:MAG TPA: recombinase RecA [Sedimentisphaerales bacterium]|nr:recombinase RecA [Sedimentisphaerales bacterium]HRS13164.1 recombinase RecA [Sedimentisphaerales bacterium]HRV49724.1 recombinase RecA [Sedimentisphaerales bacterium]